jgi:hypothetical protein
LCDVEGGRAARAWCLWRGFGRCSGKQDFANGLKHPADLLGIRAHWGVGCLIPKPSPGIEFALPRRSQ